MRMFDLTGKTALVTGASGGIGGAIARALHAQGAAVVLSGTREEALAALAGELGERAHPVAADLSDAASVDALVGRAEAAAGPLEDLVPFAEREDRMVIAYSPLAQGLLSGRYSAENRPGGVRAANPLFGTENLRRVEPLLAVLRQVADAHGVRPAQVALAWLVGLPRVVAIPGASSVEQLESNVAAAELDLAADEQAALTAAARAFTPVSAVQTLLERVRERVGSTRAGRLLRRLGVQG